MGRHSKNVSDSSRTVLPRHGFHALHGIVRQGLGSARQGMEVPPVTSAPRSAQDRPKMGQLVVDLPLWLIYC